MEKGHVVWLVQIYPASPDCSHHAQACWRQRYDVVFSSDTSPKYEASWLLHDTVRAGFPITFLSRWHEQTPRWQCQDSPGLSQVDWSPQSPNLSPLRIFALALEKIYHHENKTLVENNCSSLKRCERGSNKISKCVTVNSSSLKASFCESHLFHHVLCSHLSFLTLKTSSQIPFVGTQPVKSLHTPSVDLLTDSKSAGDDNGFSQARVKK